MLQVLHIDSLRYHCGHRCRAHVGVQGHLLDPSSWCLRQIDRSTGRRHHRTTFRLLLFGLAVRRSLGQFDLLSRYVLQFSSLVVYSDRRFQYSAIPMVPIRARPITVLAARISAHRSATPTPSPASIRMNSTKSWAFTWLVLWLLCCWLSLWSIHCQGKLNRNNWSRKTIAIVFTVYVVRLSIQVTMPTLMCAWFGILHVYSASDTLYNNGFLYRVCEFFFKSRHTTTFFAIQSWVWFSPQELFELYIFT